MIRVPFGWELSGSCIVLTIHKAIVPAIHIICGLDFRECQGNESSGLVWRGSLESLALKPQCACFVDVEGSQKCGMDLFFGAMEKRGDDAHPTAHRSIRVHSGTCLRRSVIPAIGVPKEGVVSRSCRAQMQRQAYAMLYSKSGTLVGPCSLKSYWRRCREVPHASVGSQTGSGCFSRKRSSQ